MRKKTYFDRLSHMLVTFNTLRQIYFNRQMALSHTKNEQRTCHHSLHSANLTCHSPHW